MEKGSFWMGIGVTGLSLLLFLVVLLELLLFTPRPWPYADGAGWEKIILYESLFWRQYIEHCHYIEPTVLSLFIWRYWVIPLGINLGNLTIAYKETPEKMPLPQLERFVKGGGKFVFLGLSLMYIAYSLKNNFLLTPHGFVIIMPLLVLVPVITYQLIYRGVKKRADIYILWVGLWALVDFLSIFFVIMILFGMCA